MTAISPRRCELFAGLDRLAKLGLPIEATELDIVTGDEQLQADYLRDHLIAFFSHPATTGVVMWGFWEGRHWRPSAALWRRDWSIKPNGKAWTDLVRHQWWTDAKGTTDSRVPARYGASLGDYEVTVAGGGKSKTVKTTLRREGGSVAVQLD